MPKQKSTESYEESQSEQIQSKGPNIKATEHNLRCMLYRYKKPKQYSFLKNQNDCLKPQEQTKIEQSSRFQKINKNYSESDKIKQATSGIKTDQKKEDNKQTFKDFIKKIQMYNKNKIIDQFLLAQKQKSTCSPLQKAINSTQLCIKSNQQSNLSKQKTSQIVAQSDQKNNNLVDLHNFTEDYHLQVDPQQQKTFYISKPKDHANKNFIIHTSPNKSFYSKQYRRSKTQQEIKQHGLDSLNATYSAIIDEIKESKQLLEGKQLIQPRKCRQFIQAKQTASQNKKINTFYIRNSKSTQKSLNHLKIKRQKEQIDQKNSQKLKNDVERSIITIDPVQSEKHKMKEEDLSKHKKLLQTKYSKIRIRFGSSLYNKNMWKLQNKFSKENLRKQLQTICSEDIFSNNSIQKQKKPSQNSSFCEAKILEAQNSFIQKRRLLPTAGTVSRQMIAKNNSKKFFTLTNSFKRHKTLEYESFVEARKVENINGWQILEEGPSHYKIQQFF